MKLAYFVARLIGKQARRQNAGNRRIPLDPSHITLFRRERSR